MVGSINPNNNNITPQQASNQAPAQKKSPAKKFFIIPDNYTKIDGHTSADPKGHLVKGKLIDPLRPIKDVFKAGKTMYKAASKGDGDDYSIGKVRDAATLLGSVAIGSYYSAKKGAPLGKGMEFVGLASWYTAMAAWPGLVIGLPTKIFKGVDINEKYVDSYGREKMVWEDYQYNPALEMMSDERINKIGDKLGIPNNIENRRDAVEAKMKQVAIQSNTLWILSAGLATPLLSSLIADQLRHPIGKAIEKGNILRTSQALKKAAADPDIQQVINYKKAKAALEAQKAQLEKAGEKADKEAIQKLNDNIAELTAKFKKDVNTDSAQEAIKTYRKAIDDHYKVTLGDVEGSKVANDWAKFYKNIGKHLGIKGDKAKEIANAKGKNLTEAITQHLLDHAPNSKLDEASKGIYKFTSKASAENHKFSEEIGNALDNIKELAGAFEGKESKDILHSTAEMQHKLATRIKNTDVCFFKIFNLLDKAKTTNVENVKTLKTIIEGFNNDTIKNASFIKLFEGTASREDVSAVLKQHLGDFKNSKGDLFKNGSKVFETLVDDIHKELGQGLQTTGKLKAIGDILGIAPDMLIQNTAKEAKNYSGWLKPKGTAAAVLAGVTLLGVALTGRQNKYNPDVYKVKEDNNANIQ